MRRILLVTVISRNVQMYCSCSIKISVLTWVARNIDLYSIGQNYHGKFFTSIIFHDRLEIFIKNVKIFVILQDYTTLMLCILMFTKQLTDFNVACLDSTFASLTLTSTLQTACFQQSRVRKKINGLGHSRTSKWRVIFARA